LTRISAPHIVEHFSELSDPRHTNKHHQLIDIIVIAICAVICAADDWCAVEEYGKAKQAWFEKFLELAHGIPSHDTFRRVFAALDAEQFQAHFMAWIKSIYQVTDGEVVPIDGKMLRRSHDRSIGKDAIHMVSAWSVENNLVLGQVKVDDKSNEITAIPQLLDLLDLGGCIVTIDAIRTIVMVKRERRLDKVETEIKYYISSLLRDTAPMLKTIRSHWGIENGLH